jgi:hypothetical protein
MKHHGVNAGKIWFIPFNKQINKPMKLTDVLQNLNSTEKGPFLKIINQIITEKPKNLKEIEKILSSNDLAELKQKDDLILSKVFSLLQDEYMNHIRKEFTNVMSHLDIAVDILTRDGNGVISREMLDRLYEKEIDEIKLKAGERRRLIESEVETEDSRIRDYRIYKACVCIAYENDRLSNDNSKITSDEQSLLDVLMKELDLSPEEVKLINYSIIPLKKQRVDNLIDYLQKNSIVFHSRRNHQIYVPEEMAAILRKIRGRDVSDKVLRKVLRKLKGPQVNLIAKRHNIKWKQGTEDTIEDILHEGLTLSGILLRSMHKEGVKKIDKRTALQELLDKGLKIKDPIPGASLEAKVENFIAYLNREDNHGNIGISLGGYDKLILDLKDTLQDFEKTIRETFYFERSEVLNAESLLLCNLKPIDVLNVLHPSSLKDFCEKKQISLRGDEIANILAAYRDLQSMYLENYVNIANRNINTLIEYGLEIPDGDLSIRFEELTKIIFQDMGLQVDEDLRKQINTKNDKIDILIRVKGDDVVIVECKTLKDGKEYNSYSRTTRQIKAYQSLAEKAGLRVVSLLLVAPEFSPNFVVECGTDTEMPLSMITAKTLLDFHTAFQKQELKQFPIAIRGGLIDDISPYIKKRRR